MDMKSILFALLLALMPANAETFYLVRPQSVTTETGVIGFAYGTPLIKISENEYEANGHKIKVEKQFVTSSIPIIPSILPTAAPVAVKPAPAPVVVPKAQPRVVVAPVSRLNGASLQVSGGLGGSGVAASNGGASAAYGRTKGGFYVNGDGSLGKRPGQK